MVQFVRGLGRAQNFSELIGCVKKEQLSFRKVKDPILVYGNFRDGLDTLFFQGTQIKRISGSSFFYPVSVWRWNHRDDSRFLANLLGRPFGKVIAMPLGLQPVVEGALPDKRYSCLFFEHDFDFPELHEFLEFFKLRFQALSIATGRLQLEEEHLRTSLLWEKTFDGLKDPIAIFDAEGHLLRSNRAFQIYLLDCSRAELQSQHLRVDDKYYSVHSYPITVEEGGPASYVINHYLDVSLAQKLKTQMIQNEKMAALGQLAGNIAHELNNPLTGLMSLAQVLLTETPKDSRTHGDLLEVEAAAQRCQAIIANLLAFSEGSSEKNKKLVRLRDIVDRTFPLLKSALRGIEYDTQYLTERDEVFVEPQLLQQVVFNIVKNACQAMGEKGKLLVKTEPSKKIGHVDLVISDTGPGISPEVLSRIFDFFFTTKKSGQGTGLGLSLSKSIIERFGGTLSVKSELGVGSSFVISLKCG